MSMAKARLKEKVEVHLPSRVASILAEAAAAEGCSAGTVAATVIGKWAAMVEAVGLVDEWRAVSLDAETVATLAAYAAELGDDEALHLHRALFLFFYQAAERKRQTGEY